MPSRYNPNKSYAMSYLHTNMTTGIFFEAKVRYLNNLKVSHLAEDQFRTAAAVAEMIDEIMDNTCTSGDYMVRKESDDSVKLLKKEIISVSEVGQETIYLEVVPLECAFDLVTEAHCDTKHGKPEEVYEILKRKFYLPLECVELVIAECLKCSDPQEEALERGIGEWRVNIIDVSDIPRLHNPRRQEVLVIIDMQTNFTILRPLPDQAKTDLSEEIEFIFTEYGYPEKIYVPESLLFLENVIEMLWATRDMTKEKVVVEQYYELIFEEDFKNIVHEFTSWIHGANDVLLQLACTVVPFKMNATHQAVVDPNTDEVTIGVPLNMFYRRKQMLDHYYD